MAKAVFVTVGTTKFDALIKAVDSLEVADALAHKGFTRLIIQKGNGPHFPRVLVPEGQNNTLPNGLQIEVFDYSPSLASIITSAELVISHAGSGSIFETLTAGRPLLVVPNPLLMDNHQAELGDHLAKQNVLACAAPSELLPAIKAMDASKFSKYKHGSPAGIIKHLDQLMGLA